MRHLQRRSPRSLDALVARESLCSARCSLPAAAATTPRAIRGWACHPGHHGGAERLPCALRDQQGSICPPGAPRLGPAGADRLYQLVQSRFFDNTRFFRAITGFMVQFGLHGDPEVNAAWQNLAIRDDSVTQSNQRGTMSFATMGPGSRTTQVFINLVDNRALDDMGFSPVGMVIEGMAVIDSLYAGYGEGIPAGSVPTRRAS
ncbi:MAG: peptidylprolyl isomerase [Bacteroidales bacterium]|nr:peptidylprolyl isomerase [Bacteroidales bacterium]